MRILFVTGYYQPANVYGGPTQSTAALCSGLQAAGAQVTVLTTDANGPGRLQVRLCQPVEQNGVTVYYYPLTLGGLANFYSGEQHRAIKKHIPQCDLVVSQVLWGLAGEVIRSTCQQHGIPYIIEPHGQLQPWALAHHACKKRLYLAWLGNRIIAQAAGIHYTDAQESQAAQASGFKTPAFIVPNGVDFTHYDPLPGGVQFRQQYQIPEQARVLLFLGRMDPVKRPDLAIQVCAALQDDQARPVHLIMAGPATASQEWQVNQWVNQANLAGQVHFTGLLSNGQVLEALAASDLLIMPSAVRENFGMSALEALAAGVPILASDGVPVGEWAVEAGAGRQVACDREAFVQAARQMLADEAGLRQMGQRGRALVSRRFAIQVIAREMLAHFTAILTTGAFRPDEVDPGGQSG